eukprot:TRINITY_DN80832_c0_g1_i1.p1 TRINITY_DN80832_c0_g1~~TRINITY_DN80832_c0_g1_i1.p1  ORF type:complete len:325 (+),score=26.03 TRINITY_DN80832_c0_g1_i1:63-1037(+)
MAPASSAPGAAGRAVRFAITDFLFTIVWAIGVSSTGACVAVLAPLLAVDEQMSVALLLAIAIVQILGFGGAAAALGGASFNPLANLINYLADEADETALGLLLRLPAQTAGMLIGTTLTWEIMPESLRHTVQGPAVPPGMPLLAGAAAEFLLTFLLNLVVLWAVFLGPKSEASKVVILVTATLVAIAAGASFSGPSMNPLFAFGWVYTLDQEMSIAHFAVYWAAPTAGAVLAAAYYRIYLKPHKEAALKEAARKKDKGEAEADDAKTGEGEAAGTAGKAGESGTKGQEKVEGLASTAVKRGGKSSKVEADQGGEGTNEAEAATS